MDLGKGDRLKNATRGVLLTLLVAVSWGLYPPAAKMAYEDGANWSFLLVVTLFFRALGLVLTCLCRGKSLLPPAGDRAPAVAGGFFQALTTFGIIASLRYLPGPITVVVVLTHTTMLLLYLAYRGESRLTPLSVSTTVSALLGISFVVDVWSTVDGANAIGISLALLAAVATTTRFYVFSKQVQHTDPAALGARVFSIAFLFTLLSFLVEAPVPPASAMGLVWVGICSLALALGTIWMFFSIALIGAFQFSLLIKLEPLFTSIFSIFIVNEVLSLSQYLGMGLVISSLLIYQYFDRGSQITAKDAKA